MYRVEIHLTSGTYYSQNCLGGLARLQMQRFGFTEANTITQLEASTLALIFFLNTRHGQFLPFWRDHIFAPHVQYISIKLC